MQSTNGFKYYIQFLDDFSRFSWIYPLKGKNEAFFAFVQFKNLVQKQFERSIKIVQSDWGGEYKFLQNSWKMRVYCSDSPTLTHMFKMDAWK